MWWGSGTADIDVTCKCRVERPSLTCGIKERENAKEPCKDAYCPITETHILSRPLNIEMDSARECGRKT